MFQTLLSNTLYTFDQQLYLIVCLYIQIQMQMQIYFKNLDNLKYTQCFQDFSCHLDAHYTFTCLSCSSQRSPSPGPNHTCSSNASTATVVPQNASARPACSLTPTLAAHFNDNLIKHVQGWPADHAEKQASRLREEAHNMGSVHMSEICTELENLRSLVRVCEIQATLREQR